MAALIVTAATASAEPLGDGKTVLKADRAALRNLSERGVTAGVAGGAAFVQAGVRFPVDGGELRDGPRGTVEHAGRLLFAVDPATTHEETVGFTDLTIRFGSREVRLFARSGGSRMRFFDLDMSGATHPGRFDNPFRIKHIAATLARPAAERISEKLGVSFEEGDPVGNLNVKPLVEAE